jgi:fumarate reductase subunit D
VIEISSAALAAPAARSNEPELWYNAMAGVIVAGIGLLVLFGVVAVAILTLPDDEAKAQNVIAVASSAFGVIGTIVGAYFGVRAANRAVDRAHGKP